MADSLSAIEEAERAGFDLTLVEESLSYSYEQRAVHHQRALDLALEMDSGTAHGTHDAVDVLVPKWATLLEFEAPRPCNPRS